MHAVARAVTRDGASEFTDIAATKFPNSEDYWTLTLYLDSDFTAEKTYEGAFYVEANDGTRLWLNASEGGRNFVLNTAMLGNLEKLREPGHFARSPSPDLAVVPANEFPYLNAQGCR